MTRFPITADQIRFIRLGEGGGWAAPALAAGELVYGDDGIPEALASAHDWSAIERLWLDRGRTRKAGDFVRELRDFYTLGETCLWITFHDGLLWWGYAEQGVTHRPERPDARSRTITGGWSCKDADGMDLRKELLSSHLTKTSAYPQTICAVEAHEYLLRRINCQPDPDVEAAKQHEEALINVVQRLIERLHWKDLEVLADRLAEASGWRRTTALGGSQAIVDFEAHIPAIGVRGYFQVKADASWKQVGEFASKLASRPSGDRRVFVCPAISGHSDNLEAPDLEIWTGRDLAARAVRLGFASWIVERSR